MTKKRPTTGIEDFAQLIHEGYYYVDKTYVVKELLESGSNVSLFTRPRRFGKTLLMDMLKCFFEIDGPKDVFEGLKISQETKFRRIDCADENGAMLPPDAIFEKVKAAVDPYLS